MRYGTVPAWTFIMLIVLGGAFIAGSAAFLILTPAPTGVIVGTIWMVMGAGMAFFSLRALRGRRDDERIRRTGTAATATLVGASMTGLTINNMPQWKLGLRIDGAGSPYETAIKLLTYNPPPNGTTMHVRVDPVRRDHVVLTDDDGPALAPAPMGVGGVAPQVEAAIVAALRQAGLGDAGTTSALNADGSRTITSTTFTAGDMHDAAPSAAETVRLLDDLDRMHASGALGDAEFEAIKRKLLGGE
ncbi:MAG: hypothetical protein QOJ39_264 [Candidatus Eremiobacteraeota bacterium]|nr:hypothetical protein [Candidatus Eremiobacteraeota bacterium]